jgi:hypothetical protein
MFIYPHPDLIAIRSSRSFARNVNLSSPRDTAELDLSVSLQLFTAKNQFWRDLGRCPATCQRFRELTCPSLGTAFAEHVSQPAHVRSRTVDSASWTNRNHLMRANRSIRVRRDDSLP